jgi:hypothetical protein
VRARNDGTGRCGRIGDEPSSSAVEDVEKAGDAGRSSSLAGRLPGGPSSAIAAGGGDERNEDVVLIVC